MIIEDDYDAEFRYDRDPVGSLQGLAPDRVIVLGTVSKSLAPALRLGWAVAPAALLDARGRGEAARRPRHPRPRPARPRHLIESGRYDRHLRRMRAEYAHRRDVLVDALARHAPHVRVTGLAAGFHAVAHLPAGTDEDGRSPGPRSAASACTAWHLRHAGGTAAQLVLGFGNTGARAIEAGIRTVADLLRGNEPPHRRTTLPRA